MDSVVQEVNFTDYDLGVINIIEHQLRLTLENPEKADYYEKIYDMLESPTLLEEEYTPVFCAHRYYNI